MRNPPFHITTIQTLLNTIVLSAHGLMCHVKGSYSTLVDKRDTTLNIDHPLVNASHTDALPVVFLLVVNKNCFILHNTHCTTVDYDICFLFYH